MATRQRIRRSRDGCWTCRRRRKKCDSDGTTIPCGNCQRLNLRCETGTKLLWEDDERRDGMRRRGPPKTGGEGGDEGGIETARNSSLLQQQQEDRHTTPTPDAVTVEEALADATGGGGARSSAVAAPTRSLSSSPPRSRSPHGSPHGSPPGSPTSNRSLALPRRLDDWPFELSQTDSQLLNHYIQRFSRTYPTHSGPQNPFLRVFVPLSMHNRVVLDAILAVSAAQSWDSGHGHFTMERHMLSLRHRVIRGSTGLIFRIINATDMRDGDMSLTGALDRALASLDAQRVARIDITDILALLASCMLLLLYEKLTGDSQVSGTPHHEFFSRLFPAQTVNSIIRTTRVLLGPEQKPWVDAVRFLWSMFLYNDLVRSTSYQLPTLSRFYLGELDSHDTNSTANLSPAGPPQTWALDMRHDPGRFDFPRLVARIGRGDASVTDADIAAWNGRIDWFPSFSLSAPQRVSQGPGERLPVANAVFVSSPGFRELTTFVHPAGWGDRAVLSELYRIAAVVYRRQCMGTRGLATAAAVGDTMGNLPSWALQLVKLIPAGSALESCLLWPIGIIGKELSAQHGERAELLARLQALEQRFRIRLYYLAREHLIKFWSTRDRGATYINDQSILCG